mgnify:CR=1 FL=1
MVSKSLCAGAAFVLAAGSLCPSLAGEGADRTDLPAEGAAPGAPPGNDAISVDPLRWLTPQGGETLCLEGAYPLMWTGGDDDRVRFSLIRMDIFTVVPGAPEGDFDNDGRDTWMIPATVKPGEYSMYIERVDRTDWRYSAAFEVKDCGCPAP